MPLPPLRICQVIASQSWGGLEKHFVELCNRLAQRHEVTAIGHADFRCRMSERVKYVTLDLTRSRWNPIMLWRLRQALRAANPQIIHTHANKATAMVGLAGRGLGGPGRGLGAKFVGSVHGFQKSTSMYRRCDRVIAVSKTIGEHIPNAKVEVVYNGVERPELPDELRAARAVRMGFLARTLGVESRQPVAIAAGRLDPVKGYDVLLNAWRQVDAVLLIAGDGDERGKLESQIADLKLQGRVHLLGQRSDVPALMAASDLAIISSRREGFPYVLCEALIVRTPMVSTQVPGAMEILPADFLVPTEDAPALAACVNRALSDLPATRAAFEPVWQFAAENLTIEAMVRKTEAVYARALSSGG